MKHLAVNTIGIFDSGVGGLTVLESVRRKCPNANIVYLGDTARLPYGTKSPETIIRYLEQNIQFMLKKKVDAVIVACNSASSILDKVKFQIPVHGVINAGSAKALEVTKNRKIAILGTKATVSSRIYSKTIGQLSSSAQTQEYACPLLVPLVEEGMIEDPVTHTLVARYLEDSIKFGADTIILGCTHYPLLKSIIEQIVGKDVHLVDSAECMADLCKGFDSNAEGNLDLFFTDTSTNFVQMAQKILNSKDLKISHINL